MIARPARRRLLDLVAILLLIAAAACADISTAPPRRAPVPTWTPRFDLSDTTACWSGYVVINGRVVCN
jgi:hypothetical protein